MWQDGVTELPSPLASIANNVRNKGEQIARAGGFLGVLRAKREWRIIGIKSSADKSRHSA
jgi:hypothetical protein